jgi:hypothetical protein
VGAAQLRATQGWLRLSALAVGVVASMLDEDLG